MRVGHGRLSRDILSHADLHSMGACIPSLQCSLQLCRLGAARQRELHLEWPWSASGLVRALAASAAPPAASLPGSLRSPLPLQMPAWVQPFCDVCLR